MRIFLGFLLCFAPTLWGKEMISKATFLALPHGQQLQFIQTIQKFSIHSDRLTKVAYQVSFSSAILEVNFAHAQSPAPYLKKISSIEAKNRCLVGGWISEYNSSFDKCKDPRWLYQEVFPKTLTSKQFLCNPILFGDSLIVSLPNNSYNNVSLDCYRLAVNKTNDILTKLKKNPKALDEFIAIAQMTLKSCLCDSSDLMNEKYQDRIFHHSTCAGLLAQVSQLLKSNEDDEQCINSLNSSLQVTSELIIDLQANLSKIANKNFSIEDYKKYISTRTNSPEYCAIIKLDGGNNNNNSGKPAATNPTSPAPSGADTDKKDEAVDEIEGCNFNLSAQNDEVDKKEPSKAKIMITGTLSESCPTSETEKESFEIRSTVLPPKDDKKETKKPDVKEKKKDQNEEKDEDKKEKPTEPKTETITLTKKDDKYIAEKTYLRSDKDYPIKYSKEDYPNAKDVEVTIKKEEKTILQGNPQMGPSRQIRYFNGSM